MARAKRAYWLAGGVAVAIAAALVVLRADLAALLGSGSADQRFAAQTFRQFCIDCHDADSRSGEFVLEPADLAAPGAHAEAFEKVAHKLRARTMPPLDEPRPEDMAYERIAGFLEGALDAAAVAEPEPGQLPLLHRLTRTEYRNAVRDLLALEHMPAELDYELLLPADNATSGFDNIADLLFVSPVVMERYLEAARKLSRLAVGDPELPVMVNIHRMPLYLPQDVPAPGLPFGSLGGLSIESYFPLDADYVFRIDMARVTREPHEIEITVDGARVASATVGGDARGRGPRGPFEFRVPVSAGPHHVGAALVRRSEALDDSTVRLQRRSRGALPAIEIVTISGPYDATGPGATPSRERIFTCMPRSADEETPCARTIIATLARRAYRRPIGDADIEALWPFYEEGRAATFDAGVERVIERVLVSPQFLYRIERIPPELTPGAPFEISPIELASRLSFFIWSSLPDDELLALAESGQLADARVRAAQVDRMLEDPRATALVDNFAAQWLFLRDVEGKDPDLFVFRDYDDGLRAALIEETELFVESILREDRSVLELITADYTFLNERLADHYGVPYVQGSEFRRVTFPAGSPRGGLLGQGSILTLTSYPTRTSPVLRGKYVLDNLLAAPPPPPPPVVPALVVETPAETATLTLREAMAAHRANPECAGCHVQMDAIGFAFEHFDAVGQWRELEHGLPIEALSVLPDGTRIDGVEGIEQLLLERPERFVSAVTEKLLMYATGRNIQYYDRPAVRAIVRGAASENYTFAALIHGIVESVPFRMRAAPQGEG